MWVRGVGCVSDNHVSSPEAVVVAGSKQNSMQALTILLVAAVALSHASPLVRFKCHEEKNIRTYLTLLGITTVAKYLY